MRHLVLEHSPEHQYSVAVLIKETALKQKELIKHISSNITSTDSPGIIGIGLPYEGNTPPKMKDCKAFLEEAIPQFIEAGVKYLMCCDSGNYFKALTKARKIEPYYGYVMPCLLKGFEDTELQIIVCPNYQSLFFNPANQHKMDLALQALNDHKASVYVPLGSGIIHSEQYPESVEEFARALASLHQYPALTADIETFSLKHYEAGLGSIAFAWDQHNGFASCIDYALNHEGNSIRAINPEKRALLKQFLTEYQGTLIWHGVNFDVKVLIYELWMTDLLDQKGLLQGLEVMTRNFHCTKIISYLATNSCNGNSLGLKQQAHEFAGNWAKENIKNILLLKKEELLRYNLVDCLSTWFTYNKNQPKMIQDEQEYVYNTIFIPSVKTLIQTELTGNPLNMEEVKATQEFLLNQKQKALKTIHSFEFIKDCFLDSKFNPNSGKQLQKLIYEYMGYKPFNFTKTKQPSTDSDTLQELHIKATEQDHALFFRALLSNNEVEILLNNFIKNMLLAPKAKDGWHYLFGNFNSTGTISGRMSCNSVNLQQLPSGGNIYAKHIKKCFQSPPGWIMVGSDYNGLEDVVNTILTRDPNKEKILIDKYDGHSFRAYYFFPDKLAHIKNTVESINSIKANHPEIRSDAKAPAFSLQYNGTWRTLVTKCGFPKEIAQQIETNYQKMYQVSIQWVQNKLNQAKETGYVTLAFGLRLRTPILKARPNTSIGAAEGRTAGNAVSGQSYGMINSKSTNEFMEEVWQSKYVYDIKPIMQIHDAQYYLIKDDSEVVTWVNEKVPFHMINQSKDLPELQHPDIKLGAELDLHYQGWHQPITLPNHATEEQIISICSKKVAEYNQKD